VVSVDQVRGRSWVRPHRVPDWRREALRTTLWVVPAMMVVGAVALFALTYALDRAAGGGDLTFPGWVSAGGADAARQVLIGLAAAVITVAGVVFSVTILALQLASQQFGPRMLRNFIRDLGTQASLGAFVATFVYAMLALASVGQLAHGEFVPHLSVTVALGLTLADLGVLIYFINHVAKSIQLTSVVSGIARDFRSTLEDLLADAAAVRSPSDTIEQRLSGVRTRLEREGASVPATGSGFLQAVGHDRLVRIAASTDAIIALSKRPGQFIVEGQPLAMVWPPDAAAAVAEALARAHIVGPNRTLTQDLALPVDQLVEVAIRALSPAVNDTFTALTCIDWLGDCLCRAARAPLPDGIYRAPDGVVRLVDPVITFERLLKGSYDKIRQAGRGMPAVLIRQLDNLRRVSDAGATSHSDIIAHQAAMILRAGEESVPEESDRRDVQLAYAALVSELRLGEPSAEG
jgi:uncharacterized membrane protein